MDHTVESSVTSTNIKKMKPAVAADEMFPEGVGPYMDMEEVFENTLIWNNEVGLKRDTYTLIYY